MTFHRMASLPRLTPAPGKFHPMTQQRSGPAISIRNLTIGAKGMMRQQENLDICGRNLAAAQHYVEKLSCTLTAQMRNIDRRIDELETRQSQYRRDLQQEITEVENRAMDEITVMDARLSTLQREFHFHQSLLAGRTNSMVAQETFIGGHYVSNRTQRKPRQPLTTDYMGSSGPTEEPQQTVPNSNSHFSSYHKSRTRARAKVDCQYCLKNVCRDYLSKHQKVHCRAAREARFSVVANRPPWGVDTTAMTPAIG